MKGRNIECVCKQKLMNFTIEAVYQTGAFKPLTPVEFFDDVIADPER